jgi:hypothetical protein
MNSSSNNIQQQQDDTKININVFRYPPYDQSNLQIIINMVDQQEKKLDIQYVFQVHKHILGSQCTFFNWYLNNRFYCINN